MTHLPSARNAHPFGKWTCKPSPASPDGLPPTATARYEGHEVNNVIYRGTLPSAIEVYSLRLSSGRYFTEAENQHRVAVAVIGYDIANTLFIGEDPLGKELQVSGSLYTVIGVLEKRKGGIVGGQADALIYVPYRTYQKHNPQDDENVISAMAFPGQVDAAEDEIRGVLRLRRKVPYDKPDNFGQSSSQQIADQFRQITSSVAELIVAVSSIGLLNWRRRRDEHHAHVGHAAHEGDRHSQSRWRPPPRCDLAVPY